MRVTTEFNCGSNDYFGLSPPLSIGGKHLELDVPNGIVNNGNCANLSNGGKRLEVNIVNGIGTKGTCASISSTSGPKFLPSCIVQYTGILLTIIASLFFSIGTLIVEILNDDEHGFNSFSASFWRYVGVSIPALPLLMYFENKTRRKNKESVFATVWPLQCCGAETSSNNSEKWWTVVGLMVRGLLGGSGVILRYLALEYLTIADTSVITFATPVFVTVMAHVFLGEKCGVIPMLAAITTLIGIVLMTRPPFLTGAETFDTNLLIGTGYAFGSLLCSSLILIITRKIRNVHFSLMTFVFGVIGMVQAFCLATTLHVLAIPEGRFQIILILVLMVLAFLAQMAIILAVKFEQAGPVSLIRSCDIIFGFIFQVVFIGVPPDALSLVGGGIVLSCVSVTALRKWVSTLPKESKHRRRLQFLLL